MLRLSLPVRVSLLILLLVALLVGFSSWWLIRTAEETARTEVAAGLSEALSVQSSVQQREYEKLALQAQALAADPVIQAHLSDVEDELELADLDDQLDHLRSGRGLDLLAVIGPNRRPLVESGAGVVRGLSGAVFDAAVEARQAQFVVDDETTLLATVLIPLVRDFDLLGFLLVGSAFDDAYLQEITRMTPGEILMIGGHRGESEVRHSTLETPVAAEVLRTLRTMGSLEEMLGSAHRQELEVEGESMSGVSAALYGGEGEQVGASLALLSLDERLVAARRFRNALLVAGASTALLGSLLAWLVLRGADRPIERTLQQARALAAGDFDARTGVARSDAVGELALTLDGMAAALGEQQELTQYVRRAARALPNPRRGQVATRTREESVALVMIDVRGRNSTSLEPRPEDLLEGHARDLSRARAAVKTNAGRIEAQMGHRLLASFPSGSGSKTGRGALFRALRAGVVIQEELGEPEHAFEDVDPPAIVITTGKVQTGSHSFDGEPERIVIGAGVRQLEGLLREAGSGDLMLSANAWQRLLPRAESCGLEVRAQRGLLTPQEIYPLSLVVARTLLQPLAGGGDGSGEPSSRPWPEQSDGLATSDLLPEAGEILDERFALQTVVGAGNLGRIFRAHDAELDDVVLVEACERTAFDSDGLIKLENRIERARQARHASLERVLECGSTSRVVYTCREHLAGLDLRFLLDQAGPLPVRGAVRVAQQLAEALAELHTADLLHGNVASEQVRLSADGNAYLTGHGLLWPLRGGRAAVSLAGDQAPELRSGATPDVRTDLYCLGVVLYELFTGKPPFGDGKGEDEGAPLLDTPLGAEVVVPPTTVRVALPAGLDRILLALLDDDPERRPARASEVAASLSDLKS